MIDLSEALRELVDTVPPATAVDPYAAIQESCKRRRRRRQRWTAACAVAAVACGTLAFTAWPRVAGRQTVAEPSAPADHDHGLEALSTRLRIWGFTVSGWTRTDGERSETWTASLGPRPGIITATFGTGTGLTARGFGASPCTKPTCTVLDDGPRSSIGSVNGPLEYDERIEDHDSTRYVVIRSFRDGTRAVLTLDPIDFFPDEVTQVAQPYLTPSRLRQAGDALGAPPARYELKDEVFALCHQSVPSSTEVLAAYHTSVGAVVQEHSWPIPGTPAKRPWSRLDVDQDAAWCITQSGRTWDILAATTGGAPVVFTTTVGRPELPDINGPA